MEMYLLPRLPLQCSDELWQFGVSRVAIPHSPDTQLVVDSARNTRVVELQDG